MQGWIKAHRQMLENPIICKDSDYLAVWVYLLLNATHREYDIIFEGERRSLQPGQLLTGRKSIGKKLKVNESKVQRILKTFENEQQIEQEATPRNRLISIVNWQIYQSNEQQNEQQVNNNRTTSEQQVNTNKNIKNIKNDNTDLIKNIVFYLNEKAGKKYQPSTDKTITLINARLKEGYTLEDFKRVIDIKVGSWKNTDMEKYLRPATLFNGEKFEGYLNEGTTIKQDIPRYTIGSDRLL